MHSYSSPTSRAKVLGALTAPSILLAIAVGWLFRQQDVVPSWLYSAPTVSACFAIFYELFEHWLWRNTFVQRSRIVDVKDIRGTYEGEFVSSWQDSFTVKARISIDQTWTKIHIRMEVLETNTSTSDSITAGLTPMGFGSTLLVYTYSNGAMPNNEDMADHMGTAEVVIEKDGKLNGRYFNSRPRNGSLKFVRSEQQL